MGCATSKNIEPTNRSVQQPVNAGPMAVLNKPIQNNVEQALVATNAVLEKIQPKDLEPKILPKTIGVNVIRRPSKASKQSKSKSDIISVIGSNAPSILSNSGTSLIDKRSSALKSSTFSTGSSIIGSSALSSSMIGDSKIDNSKINDSIPGSKMSSLASSNISGVDGPTEKSKISSNVISSLVSSGEPGSTIGSQVSKSKIKSTHSKGSSIGNSQISEAASKSEADSHQSSVKPESTIVGSESANKDETMSTVFSQPSMKQASKLASIKTKASHESLANKKD